MKKYIVSFLIALFLLTTIYNQINIQASENTETEITSVNNLQDAANYLKSEMINRNNSITFNYLGEHLTSTNVVNIYNEAIAHNGISNEGDYISGHINSYEYQYYHLTNGEDLYTQVTYTFIWLTTAAMEDEVTVRVKEVLDELNVYEKSQYEKIKAVYDYICDNVRYDHDHLETEETQLPHSAYAAIINNKAVCQGYATLLYRMLLEVGVDCRYITGYSGEERHAWNIVEIDGLYYNVDSTWDRGLSVYYRYFLCTDYNFAGHERDSRYQTTAFYQEYPMAEVPYGVEAQASGTLTNTMSWYLEKNGTLTITGSGKMPDFRNISAPWYPYINSIKTIIIEEGITTIGSYAFTRCKLATSASLPSTLLEIHTYGFDNCRSLKTITLPYGLVRIDTNAFSECVALTRVELPDTVTTVGSSVFSTCYNLKYVKLSAGMKSIPDSMFFNMDSLTTVIIPDGITEIGDTVFRGSDGITSITIPKQISKIGVAAFADCLKLSNIYVDSENPYFTSVNGVLYSKDMTKLISYPCAKTASAYNVPTGVLSLEYASFGSARYLTQLGLPESLTKIDTYAFSWCSNLTSVTIGPNVSYVGDSAFGWCTNLRSVTFKNPNTTLNWHSFTDCTSLTSIVLPSNLKTIPTGLFSDCKSLTNIVIPNTVTMIDDSAFSYCESLKTFTIPSSVSILGYGVFSYCSNLEVVNINGNIRSVDWSCFSNCNNLKFINIKGDLTGVDSTAFKNTSVKSVYIESNNALSRIVSTSSFGNMMNTVKTVAVLKSLTNIPTFVTNKYTRTCVIEYNDQFYRLYSDHSHIWYSYGNNQYYCNVCNAIKDNHTHSYTVYVTEPTCTSSGYSTYVCQCEYSYTANYTSPTAHSFNTWVETIAPTCQTIGQAERTCSVCGEVEYLELLTISHNQTVINAVEPTCIETGLTEGSYCSMCGLTHTYQEEIPALGHSYEATVTLPTCESQGFTTYNCLRCDESYVDNYVGKSDHSFINGVCEFCGKEKMPYKRLTYFTIDVQNNNKVYTDNAVLYLPSNYTPNGEAVKLIIYCKQGSSTITSTTNPIESVGFYNYLLSLGYAILGVDGVSDEWRTELGLDETRVVGNPLAVIATENAYNYVIENYNIDSNGCFISGYSQGGHYAQNVIDLTNIPILAAAEQSPVCSMRYHQWDLNAKVTVNGVSYTKAARLNVARIYGFTSISTNQELLNLQYDESLVALYDPWVRNSENTYNGFVQKDNLWYLPDNVSLDDITMTKQIKCPLKIWCSEDDSALGADVMKVFVKAIQNASGDAEISVAASGGHGFFTKQESVGTFYENNKKYNTLKIAVEIAEWFEKYGGYSCKHSYSDETKKVIAPTCTEQGYTIYTCSICGEISNNDYTEKLGHIEIVDLAVKPTCTESGLTEGSHCDRCNTILVAQLEIAPLGHDFDDVTYKWSNDYLSITAERICKTDNDHTETETVSCNYSIIYDSTCTAEGLGRYTSNEFLNNALTVQIYDEIIALKDHDYQLVVTEPTCLTQGYTTYTCHCGDSYTDDYTIALGHNFSEWVVEKEPTCNTEGKDNRVCNRCEYKDSRDTRYSSDETKVLVSNRLPDDYFNGKKIICIGDSLTNGTGVLKKERYQELLGVSLGATIKSAGISGGVLSFGGHLPGRFDTCMTTKYLAGADVVTIFLGINDWDNGVINGTYQGKLKYDESLTYYGLGYFGCDDSTTIYGATKVWCERILELKQTAGLENTMFVFATPVITSYNKSVTYSKDWNQEKVNVFGHTLREYCEAIMEVCAYYNVPVLDLNMYSGMYYHSETDNNVEYFGGDGIHPGVNGHKMMAEAFEEFLLENYSYEERSITHNTHNYKQTIKHPTCEAQGYTKYNCMDCYYTYVANYTDALGHSYEAKVTLPTCEAQGYTTYTCQCGDSYIDNYTDALGHNIVELEAKEETCTESGLTKGEYCTRCDYKVAQKIVPAKGHKYEAKVTLPTCEAQGYTTYTCHCGDSYIDNYTDPIDHQLSDWIVDKEPSETEEGHKYKKCTICDEIITEETISKLPKTKRGCRSNEVIKVIALINTMMVCSFVIRRKRR